MRQTERGDIMMFYIIGAMGLVIFICIIIWFSSTFNLSWSEEEQAMQDQEQIEYLAKWAELQRRKERL